MPAATFAEIGAYIARNPAGAALGIVPAWMIHALAELGQAEIKGDKHNQRIVDYWAGAGLKQVASSDETPWCAAFVGALLNGSGIKPAAASAKSYLNWGTSITDPVFGSIVVLHRPPVAWQGHVGFFVGLKGNRYHLLGGNQGDRVSIASFDRERVAGVRWPSGVPLIGTNIVLPVSAVNPTTA